jgi:hypothetical protein
MPSEFNKKATIREIMYLAQQQKDREMEEVFKQYGTSSTKDVPHQGIVFIDEIPPMMSDEMFHALTLLRKVKTTCVRPDHFVDVRLLSDCSDGIHPVFSTTYDRSVRLSDMFKDMDPRASCQHSHPICEECLKRLGEEAGDTNES